MLHSLLCSAWSGAAGILLRLMGFSLLTSARFLPLEICHTAEMGSHGAFSCLDSEVEFRYYTLPPSFHSQAAWDLRFFVWSLFLGPWSGFLFHIKLPGKYTRVCCFKCACNLSLLKHLQSTASPCTQSHSWTCVKVVPTSSIVLWREL